MIIWKTTMETIEKTMYSNSLSNDEKFEIIVDAVASALREKEEEIIWQENRFFEAEEELEELIDELYVRERMELRDSIIRENLEEDFPEDFSKEENYKEYVAPAIEKNWEEEAIYDKFIMVDKKTGIGTKVQFLSINEMGYSNPRIDVYVIEDSLQHKKGVYLHPAVSCFNFYRIPNNRKHHRDNRILNDWLKNKLVEVALPF